MKAVHWVRQEDSHGCLVACLAMVTGSTYAWIRQWFTDRGQTFKGQGGIDYIQVEMYLGEVGFAYRKHFCNLPGNTRRDIWPSKPFAPVHICGVRGGGAHGVVMDHAGVVLDPLDDRAAQVAAGTPERTLDEYPDVAYIIGIWNVDRTARTNQKAELLLEPMRARARELGYAIGVHGSLARDIDLIAAPWSESAVDAHELATELIALIERVNGCAIVINDPNADAHDYTRRNPQPKPHGRLGWSIHLGGGPYIDLSVMPRLADGIPLT